MFPATGVVRNLDHLVVIGDGGEPVSVDNDLAGKIKTFGELKIVSCERIVQVDGLGKQRVDQT